MNISNAKSRIEALKRSLAASVEYPKSICKLKDGSIQQIIGSSVIQPFLEGKFSEVCCDDPDLAHLLRAMDIENKVKIELITLESADKIKRIEV